MIDQVIKESPVPLYCIITCDQKCIKAMYDFGFLLSLIFAGVTTVISLYNIFMHYANFNNPYLQSKIIVLLLLPPIFSITSAFSFLSFTLTTYLSAGRTVYEIFAVFSFIYLMFSYLGYEPQSNSLDERKVYEIIKNQSSEITHGFPCMYFQKPYQISNWRKAKYFSHRCKRFFIQYLIVKIALYFLILVLQTASVLDHTISNYLNSGLYWIAAISSYLAYYYIGLLYNCLKSPLKAYRLNIKFFIINLVVFYVFWQDIIFFIFKSNILACFDNSSPSFQKHIIIFELENLLVCIQMLLLSFICVEAFSYEPYVLKKKRFGSIAYIVMDTMTIFFTEIRLFKPAITHFSPNNDKSETELYTITKSSKNNTKKPYEFKIIFKIDDCLKDHYF